MNLPFRRRLGLAGIAVTSAPLLCILAMCILPVARAQEGIVPHLPAGASDIGLVPSSQPISITLHIAPSPDHEAALMQFLTDVQTSTSPAYHQWLTSAQFGAHFGATSDQVLAINTFAAANNFTVSSVSPSGLRFTLTGTIANVESAMAPAIHQIQIAGNIYYANTATPTLPAPLTTAVTAIDGLSTVPVAHQLTISGTVANDPLSAFGSLADTNALRIVAVTSDACIEDFANSTQTALQSELRQAQAQGITVLAASGCGTRGSAGFPSALSEVTAVAVVPGITLPTSAMLIEPRPGWQSAVGLPSDDFRHEVDFTVSSLAALAQKLNAVIATQQENNAPARLGNINPTVYMKAATKGLFAQPDNATAGTWETATGLGVADLDILGDIVWQPHATNNSQTTVYLNTSYAVHGSQISVYATVIDPSFTVGYPPTGNVTFNTNPGSSFGATEPLNSGTSTSYTSNVLNAGSYSILGTYYGDGTYNGSSGTAGLTIAPEASLLSSTYPGSVALGQTFTLTVTDKSGSGVDTPYGTITVTEYGSTTLTYTQPLVTQGTGVATATFNIPAAQGGTINLSINCNTAGGNPNYTCYTPISVPLTVTAAATTTKLVSNPANPLAGQQIALTATVTLTTPVAGFNPTFTGNVTFYDNGNYLGNPQISGSGMATLVTALAGANDTVTAVYSGDGNFMSSTGTLSTTGSAPSNTSATLTVNPTSGLAGSNYILTASIGTANSGSVATGTVTFYDSFNGQKATLGSATLNASGSSLAIAQLSTTGLIAGTHNLSATFSGNSSFNGSSTNTVVLNLTDYSFTFSPTSLTVSAGSSATDTITVNALNGFTGTVSLSCTPPASTLTTCSFSPSTITTSGTSKLTITTTAPQAKKTLASTGSGGKLLSVALSAILLGLLLPGVRRRKPALFALLVTSILLSSSGCTELDNVAPPVAISGTPLGTQLFSITTSGTDGVTTTHHNTTLQVTVQ